MTGGKHYCPYCGLDAGRANLACPHNLTAHAQYVVPQSADEDDIVPAGVPTD